MQVIVARCNRLTSTSYDVAGCMVAFVNTCKVSIPMISVLPIIL